MKQILAACLVAILVSGCTALSNIIPSFWDDNQSSRIVDMYIKATNLNCAKPHLPQVKSMKNDLQWFELYSKSKGWLQRDVIKLIVPMQKTVLDFYTRSSGENQGSVAYCEIKKKLLVKQSRDVAKSILRRYDF